MFYSYWEAALTYSRGRAKEYSAQQLRHCVGCSDPTSELFHRPAFSARTRPSGKVRPGRQRRVVQCGSLIHAHVGEAVWAVAPMWCYSRQRSEPEDGRILSPHLQINKNQCNSQKVLRYASGIHCLIPLFGHLPISVFLLICHVDSEGIVTAKRINHDHNKIGMSKVKRMQVKNRRKKGGCKKKINIQRQKINIQIHIKITVLEDKQKCLTQGTTNKCFYVDTHTPYIHWCP